MFSPTGQKKKEVYEVQETFSEWEKKIFVHFQYLVFVLKKTIRILMINRATLVYDQS